MVAPSRRPPDRPRWAGTYPEPTFAVGRSKGQRDTATTRNLRDRDLAALESRRWLAVDVEEAQVEASRRLVEPSKALEWLRDLPAQWFATDDSGRHLPIEALFEKVEVPGVQSVTIHPTPGAEALMWSEAFRPVPLLLNAVV